MKKLLVTSALVALVIGSLVGFVDYVRSVHGAAKYDPPITEDEARQLRELPTAKAEAALATRQRNVTRQQWLVESVGYSYFWKGVAENSLVPILGVFVACVIVGRLQMQRGGSE